MKYLLILPLFFLSGVSYSTPDCETLEANKNKTFSDLVKALQEYKQALADLEDAFEDHDNALSVFNTAAVLYALRDARDAHNQAFENWDQAYIERGKAFAEYEKHCG